MLTCLDCYLLCSQEGSKLRGTRWRGIQAMEPIIAPFRSLSPPSPHYLRFYFPSLLFYITCPFISYFPGFLFFTLLFLTLLLLTLLLLSAYYFLSHPPLFTCITSSSYYFHSPHCYQAFCVPSPLWVRFRSLSEASP